MLDQEFRTVINIGRALMDNMQEQMGNVSREMKNLRKSQKERIDKKKTITKMKNAFDGLICGLDTVEEKNLS